MKETNKLCIILFYVFSCFVVLYTNNIKAQNKEEIRTTLLSNQVAEALGEPQRTVYWGISLPTTSPMYNVEKNKKK